MVEIPPNTVTAADLVQWYELQEQLAKVKAAEALLRSKIFKGKFPSPKEGTNSVPLNDGTGAVLKGKHTINRTIDPDALAQLVLRHNQEGSNLPRLNFGALIKYKPELVLSEYRTLTDEERHAFDQCLTIKDGSPQLEIVIPKKATK